MSGYWTGKQVAVTGGSGFIGSHLAQLLARAGARVTVVDRDPLPDAVAQAGEVTLEQVNLIGYDFRPLLGRVDTVFHLAANAYVPPSVEFPDEDKAINLDVPFALLTAMRDTAWGGRYLFASSAATYGNPAVVPTPETEPTLPISPYGVSKLSAERYMNVFAQLYGIQAAGLRLFSVFGPRQCKQVVFDLIHKVDLDDTELFVHGDGTQIRDFPYVEDVAAAFAHVAEHGELDGSVYNVGGGEPVSIGYLADAILANRRLERTIVYSGQVRPGDPQRLQADAGRLTALGWSPQVGFDEGLRRTVRWYEDTQLPVGV